MKPSRNPIFLIVLILLFIPFKNFSQNIEVKDSSKVELMTAAREIMTAAGTCALITLDKEGRPRVRVMDPFLPESDFTIWFGTNPKSRKVDQIKKNPKVTLYYLDSDASGYVMIHGIAQLVNGQKEKEKYWKDAWKNFYPNNPEDYLLIKVSPEWMELISVACGINGDPTTWKPPIVLFD
jgi:general stress protein 26